MGDNKKGCPKKTAFSCYKFQTKGLFPENELLVLVSILFSQN